MPRLFEPPPIPIMKTLLPLAFLLAAAVPAPAENDAPPADESVPAFSPDALAELKKLAESGNAGAQTELGMRLLYGVGVSENVAEAERFLRLAAARNNPLAHFLLGNVLSEKGDEASAREALEHWEKAAPYILGARYNLGLANMRGEGCLPDLSAAVLWFVRTAGAEPAPENPDDADLVQKAQRILERRFPEQLPTTPLSEICRRTEAGDADAELALAVRLRDEIIGDDLTPEARREEAFKWMVRAHAHGRADARDVFWRPLYVRERARETRLREKADAGDAAAQLELGRLYLGDMNAFPRREANPPLAAKYLRLAAAQGSAEAARLLANLEKSAPEKQ